MTSVAFGVVAAAMLLSALMVVTSRNLVRGVLWLGAVLLSTAALFVLLAAPLLAGIQVLLYAGGVMTLMIFGVMLTRTVGPTKEAPRSRGEDGHARSRSRGRLGGAAAAAALFGVIAGAVTRSPPPPAPPAAPTAADVGRELVGPHVLAFEVLSLLLLGAMIGAIVIARRRDPGAEAASHDARKAAG